MKRSDAIAGLIVGLFLLTVAIRRNASQLLILLGKQADFGKWLLAYVAVSAVEGLFPRTVAARLDWLLLLAMVISAAASDPLALENARRAISELIAIKSPVSET